MKNVIFIAPPAAGKGTISDTLIKDYGYEHLSTGDLLREEIAKETSLGKEIKELMASGKLVNDTIMIELVKEKIKSFKDKHFILDGFPRTLNQAESLNEMLISLGITNNIVIYLNIDYDLALKRAIGRLTCSNCGKSYNEYFKEMQPVTTNICDSCNNTLTKRNDDNETSFKVRFNSFLTNATSMLEYYQTKNILRKIDVDNDFNKTFIKVFKEVKND